MKLLQFSIRKPVSETSKNVKWIQADLRIPGVLKDYLKGTDVLLQFAATTSGAKDVIEDLTSMLLIMQL